MKRSLLSLSIVSGAMLRYSSGKGGGGGGGGGSISCMRTSPQATLEILQTIIM